jgi:hypothetical protein
MTLKPLEPSLPVDHSPKTVLSSHFNNIRATTVIARYAAC